MNNKRLKLSEAHECINRLKAEKQKLEEQRDATLTEFLRLFNNAPNLRDMMYLDAVAAVICTRFGLSIEKEWIAKKRSWSRSRTAKEEGK